MFKEYQVVFVQPYPEEGSENTRFIVSVASAPPGSSPGHHWQVICPYVPLTIHAFFTALFGASTSVSFVLSEFTCSKGCCKKRAMCYFFNFGFS